MAGWSMSGGPTQYRWSDIANTLAAQLQDVAKLDFEGCEDLQADGHKAWDALHVACTALIAIARFDVPPSEEGTHP